MQTFIILALFNCPPGTIRTQYVSMKIKLNYVKCFNLLSSHPSIHPCTFDRYIVSILIMASFKLMIYYDIYLIIIHACMRVLVIKIINLDKLLGGLISTDRYHNYCSLFFICINSNLHLYP